MFVIRVNDNKQKSQIYKDNFLNITVKDGILFLAVETKSDGKSKNFDAQQKLRSYSYYKAFISEFGVEIIDLNKINSASRLMGKEFSQMYKGSGEDFFIITGMIVPQDPKNTDVFMDMYRVFKENIKIDAEQKVEIKDFDFTIPNPESPLSYFDAFSLTILGKEYKADRRGNFINCELPAPLTISSPSIEIIIKKYKRKFEHPLNRDIDSDEVTVETTAGFINTRRVYLQNGEGSFSFYPFEYKGKFKIKLGRRWMENWNEYNFILD